MMWQVQRCNIVTTLDVFEASLRDWGVRIIRTYEETLEPVELQNQAYACLTGFPSRNYALAFARLCQQGRQSFHIPLCGGDTWEIVEVWYDPAGGFTADVVVEAGVFDTFNSAMDYRVHEEIA